MSGRRADIVVLGAGLAGHCAALAASARGARVLLIDAAARPGGSTLQSSGSFAFAGTDAQREAGIDDSSARLETDLRKASGGLADASLLRLYLERQADTYDWLRARGVRFGPLALSSSMSVPRSHPTVPAQVMAALQQAVADEPAVECRLHSAVARLRVEGGRVTGIVWPDGSAQPADAVVLATGGFSRNPELLRRFAPRFAQALAVGGEANTGEGLRMAWSLGADLIDMAWINGTFGMSLNRYPRRGLEPGDESLLRLAIYRGAIAVNLRGERFVDESRSYKLLGDSCLEQPEGIAFQVFDERIMAQSTPEPNSNDYRGAVARGLIRTADTVAGLAHAVGIDAHALGATVDTYNRDIGRDGIDSRQGRTSLGTGYGRPVPIDRPPYYIYPCTTAVLSTYCGLRVDDAMRVIDVYGAPIPGLHAAGEIVGGFHGAGYMSGSALGKAAIFGRVAGERAAEG